MRVWWNLAQISAIIFDICLAGVCRFKPCIIEPKVLRFWYREIEIDAISINVHEGDDVSITCDASCAGINYSPYLRWYGPDRHWINSDRPSDRIYEEQGLSDKFLKFHIQSVQKRDQGAYYCRGKLGDKIGWRLKSIKLYVVPIETHEDNNSSGSRDNTVYIDTTRRTSPRPLLSTSTISTSTRPPPTTVSSTTTLVSTSTPAEAVTTTLPTVKHTTRTTTMPKRIELTTTYGPPCDFRCNNGECISSDLRCDSIPDCFTGEDEENCDAFFLSCSEGQIACEDNSRCVSSSDICDGIRHCDDGSDEFLFRCQTSDSTASP